MIARFAPAGTSALRTIDPNMRASFLVMGSGIAPESLGEIDMRDVPPTLALLVGARMPHAEGNARELRPARLATMRPSRSDEPASNR